MRPSHPRHPRAFTIMELLFGIAVIFVLMGLLLAGLRLATRAGRGARDTATTNSLKQAVDKFIQEFGFVPPLVKDRPVPGAAAAPLTGATPRRPIVYSVSNPVDLDFLRGGPGPGLPAPLDLRFSVYSLAYYVMGGLPLGVDGKDGPGFTTPTRDGWFERKGRLFDPFFDTSKNARAVFTEDAADGLVELRDSNNAPFRYYRWLPDAAGPIPGQPINNYLNVPEIVGNPEEQAELRSAQYAVVAAGADGLFGDEFHQNHPQSVQRDEMISRLRLNALASDQEITRAAMSDNIVVIGGGK